MPVWEDEDPQVAGLKKVKLRLETELANEQSAGVKLKEQLDESLNAHQNDIFRRQEEEARAVAAETALRKKIEEYKQLQTQKDNSDHALTQCQASLAESLQDNRKLAFDIELIAERAAGSAPAAAKLAQEKAALERKVEQLAADLRRSEATLERARSTVGSGANERQDASLSKSKVVALETEVTTLKAENARLVAQAKPPTISRPSIATADLSQSTSRGRFGFGSTSRPEPASSIPRPGSSLSTTRPASSLGTHSQLPVPNRRRSSSVANASSQGPSSRDLSDARAQASALEKEAGQLRTKLAKKERDLLQAENALMALTRKSADDVQALRNELDDAREDVQRAKAEVGDVRDALRAEHEAAVKDLRSEKVTLAAKVARMESELQRRAEQLERSEERKDGLEDDLARVLEAQESLDADLASAIAARAQAEADLRRARTELAEAAEAAETTASGLEMLKAQKDDVEYDLARAQATLQNEQDKLRAALARQADPDQVASLESRVAQLEGELKVAQNDVANGCEATLAAEAQLAARKVELDEASRAGAAEAEQRAVQLAQIQSDLDAARNESASLKTAQSTLAESLATLQISLAEKDSEIVLLSGKLAQVDAVHSATLATLALAHSDKLSALVNEHASALSTVLAAKSALENTCDELSAAVEQLTTERDELLVAAESTETHLASLASSTALLNSAESALTISRAEKDALAEQMQGRLGEMQQLEDALQDADLNLAALQSTIAELEAVPKRSYDDAHVVALQATADGAVADYHATQNDLFAAREALTVAQSSISSLENELTMVTSARDEVSQRADELASRVADQELELQHLSAVQSDLRTTTDALESLRTDSEEAASQAVRDGLSLRARLTAAEVDHEEATSSLAVAESRLQILEPLSSRADAAGANLVRLQSALDDARHSLHESDDRIVQLESDLASAATTYRPLPSPSRVLTIRDDSPRHAILVTRLREERDDLRARLEYARTEARFRAEASGALVREIEDAKSRAVAALEVRVLQKASALEDATAAGETAAKALKEARDTVKALEAELEDAKLALGDKQAIEENLRAAGDELERVRVRRDGLAVRVTELEAELSVERYSLSSTRSSLNEMTAANDALRVTIDSLEKELGDASLDSTTSRQMAEQSTAALSRATERVRDLELVLETAGLETASSVERFAQLQEMVSELTAKVQRRTEQIGTQTQEIALLKSQLQIQAALSDNTSDETVEAIDFDDDLTAQVVAMPAWQTELDSSVARLAVETDARRALEAQLESVSQDLVLARTQLVDAERASNALRNEVVSARATSESIGADLAASRGALEDFESRYEVLEGQHADLVSRHDAVQAQESTLHAARDSLEAIHASLVDSHAALQAEHEAAVVSLADAEAKASRQLAATQAELAASNDRIADLQAAVEDDRASHSQSSTVIFERLTALKGDLAESERRLAVAMDDLAAARRSQAASNEELNQIQQALQKAEANIEKVEEERNALRYEVAQLESGTQTSGFRVVELEAALSAKAARFSELNALYEETATTLEASSKAVADLTASLSAASQELVTVQQSFADSTASLHSQLASGERTRSTLEAEVAELGSQVTAAANELSQTTHALSEARDLASSLQSKLDEVQADLIEALRAVDANELAIGEIEHEKARTSEELDAARRQLSDATSPVCHLDAELHAAHGAIRELEASVAGAAKAKAVVVEASGREIQTLKRLAKSAADEVELLKSSYAELKAAYNDLDEFAQRAEAITEELRLEADELRNENNRLQNETLSSRSNVEETRNNLVEVLDNLEVAEKKIEGLESRIDELLAVNKDLEQSLATAGDSGPALERVQELERMLDERSTEMEETEEKYLEILKEKKRYLAQITRLKERASFLQQDLVAAKAAAVATLPPVPSIITSAPTPTTTQVLAPVAPLSAGKKRVRPDEFDPSAPLPARAVVATVSRVPGPATPSKCDNGDKENSDEPPRHRSPVKERKAPSARAATDGVVPLKPEHLVERREPLTARNIAIAGNVQNVPAQPDGLAILRAKMNRMRTVQPVPPPSQ